MAYEKYISNLSTNDTGYKALDRRKRHEEVVIQMNNIGGNVLSEEYIQKFYDYANGEISNDYMDQASVSALGKKK
ncbi:hypothetical protein [Macrococcus capreoli]